MSQKIMLKTFKGLYPDYDTFKKDVVDKIIKLQIGAGVNGVVEIPEYMDNDKMFYKYETLYTILYNRYSEFTAVNVDYVQHGLMQNALMNILPKIHGDTLGNKNASLAKLDINKLFSTIDKRYNEDPDNKYASTETGYTSTPSGSDGNMGSFDIKKTKDKNVVNRKDATVRIREITNLIDKYGKLKEISIGAYVHEICNSFPFMSLWQYTDSENEYIVEVPGLPGPQGPQGPPGPSGIFDVYKFVWEKNRKEEPFWSHVLNHINNEKYPKKIKDDLIKIVKLMKTRQDVFWEYLRTDYELLWIDVCNNILLTKEQPNTYQTVAEETKILEDKISGLVLDETRIYSGGTDTGTRTRWLESIDGTNRITDILEDRTDDNINMRRFSGSDDKSTSFNIGIHENLSSNTMNFFSIEDRDGEEVIFKKDAWDSFILFNETDKTVRIGFNLKKPLHIGNGSVDDITIGQASTGNIKIAKDTQGSLELGSMEWGNGNTGKGKLISGNKHCLFSEIIKMVNDGNKQYSPSIERYNIDVDINNIDLFKKNKTFQLVFLDPIKNNIEDMRRNINIYWQGVLLAEDNDYIIKNRSWDSGKTNVKVKILVSLELIDDEQKAILSSQYLTVRENNDTKVVEDVV